MHVPARKRNEPWFYVSMIFATQLMIYCRADALNATMYPPEPAYADIKQQRTFMCKTTVQNNWRSTSFYDETNSGGIPSVGLFYEGSTGCQTSVFSSTKYNASCDISKGEYNLTILSVSENYHNKFIRCTVQYGIGSPSDVFASTSTVIFVRVPMTDLLISSTSITSDVTRDITVDCSVTSRPVASISWVIINPEGIIQNVSLKSSTTVTSDVSGIISQLTYRFKASDNGAFLYCSADNNITSRNSTRVSLNIYYPPLNDPVIQQIPNGPINISEAVVLTCSAFGGFPLAVLTWNCSGNATNNSSGNTVYHSIEFKLVSQDNGKTCTCSANHPVTAYRPQVHIILNVYFPPTEFPVIKQIPDGPVLTDSILSLMCTLKGGNPLATLTWNCTGIISTNSSHTTAISYIELPVTKLNHGMVCTCSALHNTNSYMQTVHHTLNIISANVTITEFTSEGKMATGRNVTMTCKAYISPPKDSVFVVWMLNDAIINPTYSSRWISKIIQSNNLERWEFRLTVINIETRDSGLLTCVVGDGFFFSEETLVLNVIGKPTVDISPRTATAILGDIVNINCTVVYSFSVTTSILWYKNGQTFNGNTGEFLTHADNAHATLVIYGIQNSAQYACSGINIYGEGDRLTSYITVIYPDYVYQYCPSNVDQFGSNWEISIENAIAINPCPGNRTGTTSRFCNSYGEWEEPNYSSCISKDLLNLTLQSELLKNGVEIKDVNSILLDLNNITDIREDLTSGELETSSEILDNIAYFIEERTANLSVDQLEIFVSSCDNLLRETNIPSWEQLKQLNLKGVTRIAKAVTVYTKAYTKVNSSGFQRTVQKDQLVVQVGKVFNKDITFPVKTQQLPKWITESENQVTLSKDNFGVQQPVGYSATYYRNISTLFHQYYLSEGVATAMNGSYDVNSVVIDFSIEPTPTRLQHPLVVQFEHLRVTGNYSNPVCAFWDFDALSTPNGAWSFVGSKLVATSDTVTVCQYDHTTNFAILMSSAKAHSSHSLVLSNISIAGCGISILFLVVTVTIYALLWRHLTLDTRSFKKEMKRDNAILLVNLCVALIISYILFLVGITLTDNKKVCTAMAVLLHYIFLVDFALMLAEGVELMINVFFVLKIISSRTKWLIPACWVAPAVIVGISVGATKLDGYGNSQYCWLSIDSKLLWTFAGPVLTVILINFIILILVMKKITSAMTHTSTEKKKKTTTEQVKDGIRRVCVILPLFGVTWVLGAFSINEETVVFQYLFAVFNSLQGFFIFLMYIVLNKQVREGIQKIRKQKADKSSTYSQKDTTKESSVPSTGLDFTDVEKSTTHSTGPINSIANNTHSHQMNDEQDTVPIHSTTPTDVLGPIINDNTKESKSKSRFDKDDKKLKLSDHRRDVLFQRSHTLAPGKQNHDGGHINQRVQTESIQ